MTGLGNDTRRKYSFLQNSFVEEAIPYKIYKQVIYSYYRSISAIQM